MSKATEDWKKLRRGWCWGAKSFREELLERNGKKSGSQHYGEKLRESEEPKAAGLVRKMLQKAGWLETELKERPKGDKKKARMAARLRKETTVSWPWIAKRLEMGIGVRQPMRCEPGCENEWQYTISHL